MIVYNLFFLTRSKCGFMVFKIERTPTLDWTDKMKKKPTEVHRRKVIVIMVHRF